MGRGKTYWISLITVALNYAGKREMLFMHEENKAGKRDQRGLAFVVSLCYKISTRGRIGVSCKNYLKVTFDACDHQKTKSGFNSSQHFYHGFCLKHCSSIALQEAIQNKCLNLALPRNEFKSISGISPDMIFSKS